jgi:hypothetical protein
MLNRAASVTVILALLLVPGCGPSPVPAAKVARIRLEDVYGLYKTHVEKLKRPPTKLGQLERWEPIYVNGYAAVNEGQIVVLWGQPLAGGAHPGVLAYERDTPEQGGHVLFQDGTVKRMAAADFLALPQVVKH